MNRAVQPQMRQQGSGLLLHIGPIAGRLALPFLRNRTPAQIATILVDPITWWLEQGKPRTSRQRATDDDRMMGCVPTEE
jgi:hypothetical protein